MRLLLCFPLIILSFSAPANSESLKINEQFLRRLANEQNPTKDQFDAMKSGSYTAQKLHQSRYGNHLSSEFSYSTSRETPIIQFSPVFDPASKLQVGIHRRLPYGVQLSAGVYADQYSTSDDAIDEATQVGARFRAEIDLWKNWLGRFDNLEDNLKRLDAERSQQWATIQQKQFVIDVRKIFWSLVSNQMSRELSEKLVKSAKKQLRESEKRQSQGAADDGDVARNRSQLYSRQAAVLFYDHQRNLLIAQLQKLLPTLNGKDLAIESVDLAAYRKKVYQCIQQIKSEQQAPMKYSDYLVLLETIEAQEQSEIAESSWLDSSEIKLIGQIQHSNTDKGYGDSLKGFGDQSGTGTSIGLTWNLPLNPELSEAARWKQNTVKLQKRAEYESIKAELTAQHEMVQSSLQVLLKALGTLTNAVSALETSLKSTERKYHQARLDLPTLIFEQDSYFNSKLSEIDTQLQTIQVLMDYFKVYQNYPCRINKIQE